jgi:hypothetical protein
VVTPTTTLTRARPRTPATVRPVAAPRPPTSSRRWRHVLWLAASVPFAFAVPFLLADTLDLDRDLFYGLYATAVTAFVAGWARHTGLARRDLTRNWRWGLGLGVAGAAVMALVALRTDDATDRPGGFAFLGALLWRGVVYGATDGVLLSVFPILAVFAAFAGTRLRATRRGTVAVGAFALLASLLLTAVYHLGYSDFRSDKLRKPLVGDVVWSAPTLLTLSPFGAPIAHVGLHVSAVAHSYDTDTFLPPHAAAATQAAERHELVVYLLRGEQLAPVARTIAAPAVATAALRSLLRGPTDAERATGLTTTIPPGTGLRSVRIARGTATVDLSRAFASGGGSLSMAARLAQVTFTLTQFPTVLRVVYLMEGTRLTTLGGEGLLLDRPQTRAIYDQAGADTLEGGLLGPVFVERPAHGAPFTRVLRVEGSATRTFTLTLVDWDGLIVAERTVPSPTGRRRQFSVPLTVEPGAYPRGALIVRSGAGEPFEIPLGRTR